jgi:hypothetical protein
MSTLNFPTNPAPGDRYTIGITTYEWNGDAWIIVNSGVLFASSLTVETLIVTTTTNINTGAGFINGGLQVYGGAWIDKDLFVGGVLYSSGQQVLTTSSFAGAVIGGVDIDVVTSTGTATAASLTWNNISTLQTVTGRGATTNRVIFFTNTSESTSTNSGGIVISGGVGVAKRVTCESLRIADTVFDSTQTLVNTTATTAIDTYSTTQFRSAKYLIQIDEGIGTNADFELREILLVADNNGQVWATEYGVVTSNGDLGTFAAEIVGSTVTLYFTAFTATNKTIKVLRTGMAV